MEETTDVKGKRTPSVPANYVSIVQLRERWIKEKERKEQEEKDDEERRRNQHAEEEQRTIQDDPKKPREDLDEMRLNQIDHTHRGGNSEKDKSTDGGEARRSEEEEEETAAIGSERGEDERLVEKKRRRKRCHKKKKRTDQEVEECRLSIKPLEYTVKENNNNNNNNNTQMKDQIRVYIKKEEKSIEKAVKAIETQFQEQQQTIQDDPKKPGEYLDENQIVQKHWGRNSKKDDSTDGGEARWSEEKETAATGSQRGEDEEKKRGRRKRYKKKRTNQVVEACGSIKPPDEYTVTVKDQKEEKAMEDKSFGWREKAATAIETQFQDLSIKRGQETKLKAQTRHDLPLGRVRMPSETATMVWVKKGQDERAVSGNASGVKPLYA